MLPGIQGGGWFKNQHIFLRNTKVHFTRYRKYSTFSISVKTKKISAAPNAKMVYNCIKYMEQLISNTYPTKELVQFIDDCLNHVSTFTFSRKDRTLARRDGPIDPVQNMYMYKYQIHASMYKTYCPVICTNRLSGIFYFCSSGQGFP